MPPTPRSPDRAWPVAALVLLVLLAVAACTGSPVPRASSTPSADYSGPAYTLNVLSSSDLADMTSILQEAAKATDVTVKLHPVATLTGAQEVADGAAAGKYDAAWFDSDDYLELLSGGLSAFDGTTETMTSPVILGVRPSVARELGWLDKPVSWSAIGRAAADGKFTFGMADPGTANSGLMGLVSVATSLAGDGAALKQSEIASASPLLAGMFHAQTLTAPTSAELARRYLRMLASDPAAAPDGLVDYESQLLTIQGQTPASDALALIYPSDGVVSATYPLSVLTSAPPAAKAAYVRLAEYLRTPAVQRAIEERTHRRPIITGVPLTGSLRGHQSFQLPFPAAAGTVRYLVAAYQDKLVKASQTVYVLDTSGSMAGSRLAGLQRALLALTGIDTTLTGQFTMFKSREQVTFLPFSTAPGTPTVFNIPESSAGQVLLKMRAYIDRLTADGHTAIYDSLVDAYQILAVQHTADPDTIESVVLLTDGESNTGRDLAQFLAYYRTLPSGRPPVYAIALGEARLSELGQLAAATGGQLFNATDQPVSALSGIFQYIRGYQ